MNDFMNNVWKQVQVYYGREQIGEDSRRKRQTSLHFPISSSTTLAAIIHFCILISQVSIGRFRLIHVNFRFYVVAHRPSNR